MTYGYTRVSTGSQAREGESLGVQQRTIAGYAMMHGLEVADTFVEAGVSGSVPLLDRPQGKALLDRLQRGDTVITPKLDRMFRSANDALTTLELLKKRGISLHMIDLGGDVTTNGVSKLVFTILSAVAESERDRIRERISTVKADQKARGHYLGGYVPFGYTRTAEGLEKTERHDEALIQIKALHAQGRSLRAIAEIVGNGVKKDAIARILRDNQLIIE